MWLLHWNEATGWDEMELVSGLCASDSAVEKPEQAKWNWGWKSRSGRKGITLAVGSNPAYELNERCERPVPVSPRTGLGSE